jgi:hypothetical protein
VSFLDRRARAGIRLAWYAVDKRRKAGTVGVKANTQDVERSLTVRPRSDLRAASGVVNALVHFLLSNYPPC